VAKRSRNVCNKLQLGPDLDIKSYTKSVRWRELLLRQLASAYASRDCIVRGSQTPFELIANYMNTDYVRATYIKDDAKHWFPDLDPSKDAQLIWRRSVETARSLDLEFGSRQLVPFREEPRSLGKPPRFVVNLPPKLRLIHRMAKDIIYAQQEAGRHIYHWPGRGTHRLVRDMMSQVKSGKTWLLSADISRCYESVNFEAVYGLMVLPPELLARTMDPSNLDFRKYQKQERRNIVQERHIERALSDTIVNEPRTPHGLLEGSPLSGALLALLFEDLPSHLPEDISVFMFSDNIFVPHNSESACREVADALTQYLAGCPAGPFSLTTEIFDLRFEHAPTLGYQVNADPAMSYDIGIGDRNLERAIERMASKAIDYRSFSTDEDYEASEQVLKYAIGCFPQVDEVYRDAVLRDYAIQEIRLSQQELARREIVRPSDDAVPWH
jgi:hypothetical protein